MNVEHVFREPQAALNKHTTLVYSAVNYALGCVRVQEHIADIIRIFTHIRECYN